MKYDKITISGRICTGKTTLFQNLEDCLDWPTFSTGKFFRDYAKKHRMDIENAEEQNNKLTKQIDYRVKSYLKKKGHYLIDGWMSGIMANHFPGILRILLVCDDKVRYKRFSKREKVDIKEAEERVNEREESLFAKLEKIYRRRDFVSKKHYNFIIDTTRLTAGQTLNKVLLKLK